MKNYVPEHLLQKTKQKRAGACFLKEQKKKIVLNRQIAGDYFRILEKVEKKRMMDDSVARSQIAAENFKV